ncbi:ABC transporter permease [Haloarchaeobius sp. HME9146]|uniref:ABC transporter permease n=1 Tax=Haloarchaeobius sp. HME9146 TaxID=2978732 RepID=UPI0021C223D2|nr:ABC transporter permease [Haloarchaeobius sp. HME9146]MCT9094903.1 ABC transporter permease [Haloarchaeobius sp. HME9146]
MRWRLVAEKDFHDSRRSRSLYVGGVLFALLGLAIGYAYGSNLTPASTGAQLVSILLAGFVYITPLLGLTFAQGDIVTKRADGELKVLLGLPFSRGDFLLGTFVGRLAVVLTLTLTPFVLSHLVAALFLAPFDLPYTVLSLLTLSVLAVIFVGLATAFSAAFSGRALTVTAAFGVFLLFFLRIWRFIPVVALYLANGFSFPTTTPTWARVFVEFGPLVSLRNLVVALDPKLGFGFGFVGTTVPPNPPWYQQPAVAAVVLGLWATVPLGLAYVRFRNADL